MARLNLDLGLSIDPYASRKAYLEFNTDLFDRARRAVDFRNTGSDGNGPVAEHADAKSGACVDSHRAGAASNLCANGMPRIDR